MRDNRIDFFYGRMLPELEHFTTPREKKDALKRATRRMFVYARVWVFFAGLLLFLVVLKFSVLRIAPPMMSLMPLVGGAIAGLGVPIGVVYILRKSIRSDLRRQLSLRGVPLCDKCGYWLQELTRSRCPECGTEFGGSNVADDKGR